MLAKAIADDGQRIGATVSHSFHPAEQSDQKPVPYEPERYRHVRVQVLNVQNQSSPLQFSDDGERYTEAERLKHGENDIDATNPDDRPTGGQRERQKSQHACQASSR